MMDEIKIYHADDPNDAPQRRLSAFPTINPFVPTSLPQYVIPPVANQLYALHYYWYSAYQQGIAAQKHQQQLNNHQQQHHLHAHHQQATSGASSPSNSHHHHHNHQHHHQQHSSLHTHSNHNHQVASPSSSLGLTSYSSSSTSSSTTSNHNLASSSCSSSSSVIIAPSSASSSSSTSSSSSSSSASSTSSMSVPSAGSSTASPVTSTTPACHNNNDNHLQHYNTNSLDMKQEQRQTPHQHIKKPLNPFMIYMQKRRPEIVKQGIIKESAAINQMLGQQWRKLTKEEQEPYYKLAEQEKIIHAQKYPGWSARDNYANQKKKKKMKLKSISLNGLDQSDKKCRARFGLNNMSSWCKPCRRKKKCIFVGPTIRQ